MIYGILIFLRLLNGFGIASETSVATQGMRSTQSPTDSTVVVLLGTGNPYPDPQRQGPATAIVVGELVLLFDAGSGLMRQLEISLSYLSKSAKGILTKQREMMCESFRSMSLAWYLDYGTKTR